MNDVKHIDMVGTWWKWTTEQGKVDIFRVGMIWDGRVHLRYVDGSETQKLATFLSDASQATPREVLGVRMIGLPDEQRDRVTITVSETRFTKVMVDGQCIIGSNEHWMDRDKGLTGDHRVDEFIDRMLLDLDTALAKPAPCVMQGCTRPADSEDLTPYCSECVKTMGYSTVSVDPNLPRGPIMNETLKDRIAKARELCGCCHCQGGYGIGAATIGMAESASRPTSCVATAVLAELNRAAQ